MFRHWQLWILLLPAILMASCDASPGVVNARFSFDSTVTEMTLTELGVPVENSLPAAGTTFELALGEATILWQASGTSYSLDLAINGNPARTTEFMLVDFPLKDGGEKILLFEFAGDQLTVSELSETYTGASL